MDWCAPPSGARVTPEGVPTRMDWPPAYPNPPWVSVNVSPIEIAQPTIVDQVAQALAHSGLSPDRLCLEVTETAAIVDFEETKRRLEQLAGLGVRIALDDFGTGHSSLTMLRDLPVDMVKIDRSFVARIASSAADAVLVRLVIDTSHSLGMTVCAEGIEDASQARQLIALGCDSAQGWYFGMPEPASRRLTAIVRGLTPAPTPELLDPPGTALLMPGSEDLVVVSTPQRRITYVSSTARTMLGWTSAEMIGTSVEEHLHAEERLRLNPVEPGGGARHTAPVTVRALHRDGSHRWLRATAQHLADEHGTVTEVLTSPVTSPSRCSPGWPWTRASSSSGWPSTRHRSAWP